MFNTITGKLSQNELQLTGRKLSFFLTKSLKNARKEKDHVGMVFWIDMKRMKNRQSMKSWTLAQLIERFNKTNEEYDITYEFVSC